MNFSYALPITGFVFSKQFITGLEECLRLKLLSRIRGTITIVPSNIKEAPFLIPASYAMPKFKGCVTRNFGHSKFALTSAWFEENGDGRGNL